MTIIIICLQNLLPHIILILFGGVVTVTVKTNSLFLKVLYHPICDACSYFVHRSYYFFEMYEFITLHLLISAMKICERHELLEVTVGYFEEELVSYETATTLVMVVAFLFPVLSLLELLLYLTYQRRV